MRDAEVRDIAGRTFEVTPLPAGKGVKLMLRIGKVLGPLAGLVGQPAELTSAVSEVAAEVLARASEDDLEAIYRPLAESTLVHRTGPQGQAMKPRLVDIFDVEFAADYAALFQWLRMALEVNFGPLMQWLAALPTEGAARAGAKG